MRNPGAKRQPYHVTAAQQVLLLGIEVMHDNWFARNVAERLTRVASVCDWIDCCQLPGDEDAKRSHAYALRGHLQTILDGSGERGPNCRLMDESYDRIAATIRHLAEDFGLAEMEADTGPVDAASEPALDTWRTDGEDEGEDELERARRLV